jgi:tRNA A-37 threonylcarbamoyl transferase component Bud32
MSNFTAKLVIKPGFPDFSDLPWSVNLSAWRGLCPRLENVNQGVSRHPVVFVNYAGTLYALKELPPDIAEREFNALTTLASLHLPAVVPVGYVLTSLANDKTSVLITQFLENSIPYRSLFMSPGLTRYRESLLDAIANLLVQLHIAGVYWGDCSLSNTLYRRDANTLQAYLVDAETAEFVNPLPPAMRYQDLEILEEIVNGELLDLYTTDVGKFPIYNTVGLIKLKYQRLWEEINQEGTIGIDENYRIQERVRALNGLGYSVGNISFTPSSSGDQIHFRIIVTDRNFHRNQLYNLTGLQAEEMQARQMVNEILELRANLSRKNNRSTPTSVAAYHWLENYYSPTITQLKPVLHSAMEAPELYCQILEHKWFLSEQAHHDVGHQVAVNDYLQRFAQDHKTT